MQIQLDLNGLCSGPLFGPLSLRRGAAVRARHRWLRRRSSVEDRALFRDMQHLARVYSATLGMQLSVDHAVPLRHPLVSGLHRAANFQIMPLVDNIRKSNEWPQQEILI